MAAITVMEFSGQMFLSDYSLDAISAVAPTGIAAFLIMAIFLGVAGYTNISIAKYCGARAHESVLLYGRDFTLACFLEFS